MAIITVEHEIVVECKICGARLGSEFNDRDDCIDVEPCEQCARDALADARTRWENE
jgi:hypothetical protein